MYFSSSFFVAARQVLHAEMAAFGIPESLIQDLIKQLAVDTVLVRRSASSKKGSAK